MDEVGTGDAGGAGARAHRQLVPEAARRRLAHARHHEKFAQRGCGLDVEVVERRDAIDPFAARDVGHPLADVGLGHVATQVVELVDRLTRPVAVAQLLVSEQQHAAPLAAAFAQELVPLPVGGDTEQSQRHRGIGTIHESGTADGGLMLSLLMRILLVVLLAVTLSGCAAIAGIFKAGVWTGVIIAVIIIVVVVALVSRG